MSRLGKKPIIIPDGVRVEIQGNLINVEGPKGRVSKVLNPRMKIVSSDNKILVERPSDTKIDKSLHGLTHKLIKNMFEGVSKGFEKKLEINGLGYRAQVQGNKLVLQVGFTHPVNLNVPEGIKVAVKENVITVDGADKELVGEFSSIIHNAKPPEPYKGTGIKYVGEQIRRKIGKALSKITTGP